MGYRFLLAVVVLTLMSSCAAFDTDNTPYAGFNPDEVVIPNGMSGPYNGKYSGTMTLDSNTCASVSDEMGAAVAIMANVVQSDQLVNIVLEGGSAAAGELSAEGKTVFMIQSGGAKHVYYLTFSDDSKMDGTCEVIEADENGQFAKSCASYTVTLAKVKESE